MTTRVPHVDISKEQRRDVERAKQSISFDEAVLSIAEPNLRKLLSGIHGHHVSLSSELYHGWLDRCLEVVREIVDTVIQNFSAIDSETVAHNAIVNRKREIVPQSHDLLVMKSRSLVRIMEPHRRAQSQRKRATGVRLIVASAMSNHDWRMEAVKYCAANR